MSQLTVATYLEHLICFIKYHDPYTLELQDALGVQVLQLPMRAHHHLLCDACASGIAETGCRQLDTHTQSVCLSSMVSPVIVARLMLTWEMMRWQLLMWP